MLQSVGVSVLLFVYAFSTSAGSEEGSPWIGHNETFHPDELSTHNETFHLDKITVLNSWRSLQDFAGVIKCVTGRSAWDYNGYGCYCGKGGHGKPVDGIDRCCQKHDRCYDALKTKFKCLIYLQPYSWRCVNHDIRCYETSRKVCRAGLCLCDTAAARCFKKYKYPKKKKRCPK